MFTNKHVIIALIVAPILSILAWFAVGNLKGEKPAPAQVGQSYPLVEKSNCRYTSDACDLENEDFRLVLSYRDSAAGQQLVLRSSHALEGVLVVIGPAESEEQPDMMRSSDGQGLEWRVELGARPAPQERIRLVARATGSTYFGEAGTVFLQPADRERLQR